MGIGALTDQMESVAEPGLRDLLLQLAAKRPLTHDYPVQVGQVPDQPGRSRHQGGLLLFGGQRRQAHGDPSLFGESQCAAESDVAGPRFDVHRRGDDDNPIRAHPSATSASRTACEMAMTRWARSQKPRRRSGNTTRRVTTRGAPVSAEQRPAREREWASWA